MRFTAETSADGVREQLFSVAEIPGVLWTPANADEPRPLILLGHGGGQHKQAPGIVARARRFVTECGFAAAALDAPGHGGRPRDARFDRLASARAAGPDRYPVVADLHAALAAQSVPEWRSVLDALLALGPVAEAPVGYWGISLGCGLGVPFAAAEPRVGAAVLGLFGARGLTADAARITVPVEFLLQWDDEQVPRAEGLALFDAFGSAEKTLHANRGGHMDLPRFEVDAAMRFFRRHLG